MRQTTMKNQTRYWWKTIASFLLVLFTMPLGHALMIMMEHLSDNAFDRRGENNPFFKISSGNLTADNAFIKRYWETSYKRIGYCNRFLVGIQNRQKRHG